MDLTRLGFLRTAAVAPEIAIANPEANAAAIGEVYAQLETEGVAVVLTPELSLTGYSCEDLFHSADLLQRSRKELGLLARKTKDSVLVVGAPWQLTDGRLLNCAFVCARGKVVGAVPKSAHPNYQEFYEQRWFTSGAAIQATIDDDVGRFQIFRDQLFALGDARLGTKTCFAIEICEDLWAPKPPSTDHALAGATVILNPSASTELIAKADYRRDLVRMQSASSICAYVYAGAGPSESTKDVVFGGHLLAAENGTILAESDRFNLDPTCLVVDLDWQRLNHERIGNTTFAQSTRPYAHMETETHVTPTLAETTRTYASHPFVPDDEQEFDSRAREILAIQTTGLARRMRSIATDRLVIGLSGGLDSTLAFLVCMDTLAKVGLTQSSLLALTMPGPGTTPHTLETVHRLVECTHTPLREIPIDAAVRQHLADLGHDGDPDVTFENAQARERTQLLFDTANQVQGIVVGTGDMSELAIGWCTYNADHMSNYNVNASIPKTLMAYLVRWYANHRAPAALRDVLDRVLDTPITPELVPAVDGKISQVTEEIIGPYELHDFFLYHFLRTGAGVEKIFTLACLAFADRYDPQIIQKWQRVFFKRFFEQQFKRTTLPPGPKVGTVSLSPRGDWRMPDEADVSAILSSIDELI